ncbi:hypothetical protein ACWGJP_05875 [Microbacterium sp. NPDC055903]
MPAAMHPVRRLLRASTAVLAIVLLAGLVACSATGDGVRDSFVREFDSDADVAEMDLSSADGAAFSGGVGGVITARDGLSMAELDALSEHIRTHGDTTPDAEVRIDLEADGWRFPVLRSAASNAELLEVVGALRADPRLVTGDASSEDHRSARVSWALVTTSTELAVEVATTPPVGVSGQLIVRDADNALSFSGTQGAWVSAGAQAWRSLGSAVALTKTRIDEERIEVTIASEQDAARADAMLGAALEGTGLSHAISSDLVTLAPGAAGQKLRAMLASVPAAERALISSAWTDDRTAGLQVKTLADAKRLARVVDGAAFETVSVSSGDALRVTAEPGRLTERVSDAVELTEIEGVSEVAAIPSIGIDITVEAAVDDAGLAAFAPALKAMADAGERVCIDRDGEGSLCVVAAEQITIDDLSSWGRRHGEAFVDAWNAAG